MPVQELPINIFTATKPDLTSMRSEQFHDSSILIIPIIN